MRKFLVVVLTLGAFALAASAAGAKTVYVPLTKGQVATVCGEKSYCEKSCGLNGEYTCGFGCGTKGCSGVCLTCPGAKTASFHKIHSIVTTAVQASARIRASTR
jgi:hypothetical protein